MSSAIVNPSQFIAMLESATAEERAQIAQVFGDMMPKKAPKEKKEPAAPVLAEGWVLKPYAAGPKKGTARWYHEENDAYTDVFPESRPSGKSNAASASASASSTVVLPTKKRLSKEDKAALSPEQKKALKEQKAAAAAVRKANRTPEEQAKIDDRVAKMKAAREAKKAAAGGAAAHEAKLTLLGKETRLHKTFLSLGRKILAFAYDASCLVHEEVRLGETTTGLVRGAMPYLRTRALEDFVPLSWNHITRCVFCVASHSVFML
jgi:hypothetical protein